MRKVTKPMFFIVLTVIVLLAVAAFMGISVQNGDIRNVYLKGASDIRWGIDIRGGVDVTFTPPVGTVATSDEMQAAKAVIDQRLVDQNITDSEVYLDTNKNRIIVRFPWKPGETDFDPGRAISELGETALLTFREGNSTDEFGLPTGVTASTIILEGKDIKSAQAVIMQQTNQPAVSLALNPSGVEAFAEATGRLAGNGVISIWMDETMISAPSVNSRIDGGEAIIEGGFTTEEAKALANKINAGALPFKLVTENYNSISPTLGEGARDAMVFAGIIAYIIVAAYVIFWYRLPGVVACISLIGQIAGTVAAITGFFPFIPSFTLTLPGIAGIILGVGIGVDCNVVTSERIKEELRLGKTLEGAVESGFSRALAAIVDGNITVIIVAIVLMGAFGPPSGFWSTLMTPVFFLFGPSTSGVIYSFGYTLLVGVILNFIMGIGGARLMLRSLTKVSFLRNTWLYGGKKNV